jgi:hypothetical protein
MQELFIQKLLWVPTHIQDASWWNAATKRYTPLRPGYYQVNFTASYKSIIAGLVYIREQFPLQKQCPRGHCLPEFRHFRQSDERVLERHRVHEWDDRFHGFPSGLFQPRAGAERERGGGWDRSPHLLERPRDLVLQEEAEEAVVYSDLIEHAPLVSRSICAMRPLSARIEPITPMTFLMMYFSGSAIPSGRST